MLPRKIEEEAYRWWSGIFEGEMDQVGKRMCVTIVDIM
jgi:hypothetical protein